MKKPVAVVIGVGASRGLGAALCRRFAREGFLVFIGGRTADKIDVVAANIQNEGGESRAFLIDATNEHDVARIFEAASTAGPDYEQPSVVVFNAGNNRRIPFDNLTPTIFEEFWRVGCFAGFLVAQAAMRCFVPKNRGTIIFTGASASLRGRPDFAHFACAKAGLRMLCQSLARQYGPLGIHVAHVVVDGLIDGERISALLPDAKRDKGEDGLLDIDAVAETYWHIHMQSRTAWTHEIDLRPFKEPF